MTCDEMELLLSEGPDALSPEALAHVAGCARCTQTAQVLSFARLPEPSATERAGLARLPVSAHSAWRRQEGQRQSRQRWFGYAVAAGLGALVASAGLLTFRPAPDPVIIRVPQEMVARAASGVDEASGPDWEAGDESAGVVDEASFFDVSWPSVQEGEAQ